MRRLLTGIGSGSGWGSLAASTTLILQIPLIESHSLTLELLELIPLIMITLLVSFAFVFLAALVAGMPILALLAAIECDEAEIVALAGAAAGFGAILAIVIALDGTLDEFSTAFALSALIGGGVTGGVWAYVREKAAQWQRPAGTNSHRQVDNRWLR